MTTGSLAFSLRLSCVTVMLTVAPEGIATPLEPVTASVVVAVTRSSTLLVFVQTFSLDASEMVVPAAMAPDVARAGVVVAGVVFVGAGVVFTGRLVFLLGCVGFLGPPDGAWAGLEFPGFVNTGLRSC